MEKIATSFCSFEALRKHYTYVDKTDMLWRLVSDSDDRMFFISRPRRFGKSLMLDTLKCIFEGRRELFRGLKIEKRRYDWKKYPVVSLSMDEVKGETPDQLIENLIGTVAGLVARFGLEGVREYSSPGKYFGAFLSALAEKHGPYVVLIDEYDVPLQGFLGNPAGVKRVRGILHDFYVQLKSHSGDIRFMMMTGVTKLTKLSVFSGLNNPEDLTMDHLRYAGLLGYTPKEIEATYPKRLDALAKKLKTDRKGALKRLLDWYHSYRFCPDSRVSVCNPISIAKALKLSKLDSYWVKTAVSTLVMERMEAARKAPSDFEGCTATKAELDLCDAMELPVKSLMYQSGYLTIKGLSKTEVDEIGNPALVLGAPNHEVRGALKAGWFDHFVKMPATEFEAFVDVAKGQIASGDLHGLSFNTEVNGQRYFVLNLKAHGRFIRHDGKNVSSGKPVVTVGFFPGCVTARPFPCNVDFQRWIDIPGMAFFSNFAFLGLPTISAVFVEPFRDYYESPFSPRLMTDCALFGCRKHFEDVRYRSFSEKSRQIVSEVKLFAFKVEIDGKTYTDFDYGEGYDGRVIFSTSRSRGSTVRMRIVGAPSTRGDSSDRLSDLVGIEMDAVLP